MFKGRREAGFEGGYTLNELTDSRIDLRLLKVLCRGLEGEKKKLDFISALKETLKKIFGLTIRMARKYRG